MTETMFKTSEQTRRTNRRGVAAYRERNRELVRARNREYFRRRAARRAATDKARRDARYGYVLMFGCTDCGTFSGRLDLDHRDDELKLFDPSQTNGRAWETLWTEWAKCDVRCASCHALRHDRTRVRRNGKFA